MNIKNCVDLELKYKVNAETGMADTQLFGHFLSDNQETVANFLNEQFVEWLNATQEVGVVKTVSLDVISVQMFLY